MIKPLERNHILENYLECFKRELSGYSYHPSEFMKGHELREKMIHDFSFAVPNEKALKIISSYSPLIEVGAGRGYWASLLKQRGADIIAFDCAPPHLEKNAWHNSSSVFYEIGKAKADITQKYSDRTLFLCWPPYNTSMASQALKAYSGDTVIYIGEGEGGCTGDEAFHTMLETDFLSVKQCAIPQWPGLHDYLTIYNRI